MMADEGEEEGTNDVGEGEKGKRGQVRQRSEERRRWKERGKTLHERRERNALSESTAADPAM